MADLEQKTIDELNRLLAETRSRFEKMEQGIFSKSEFEEAKAKIQADADAINARIDALEAKANTPSTPTAPTADMEVKAFSKLMAKGSIAPDEQKLLAMDVGENGGYFMPVRMSNSIIEALVDISPIRQFSNVVQVDGDVFQQAKEAGSTSTGWLAERGTTATTTNNTFTLESIPLHIIYAEPYATQKSLDMASFNFESWLSGKVSQAIAKTEGTAFVSGSGVGTPEGILTHASVEAINSGNATALTADGIMNLVADLPGQYENGARFFMRKATAGAIWIMKDGAGRYLWQPSYQAGIPNMLAGYPVTYAEDVPAVAGSAYPIIFGNLQAGYQVVDSPKMTVIRDNVTQKGFVLFYTQKYVGGQVVNAAAIKKQYISA